MHSLSNFNVTQFSFRCPHRLCEIVLQAIAALGNHCSMNPKKRYWWTGATIAQIQQPLSIPENSVLKYSRWRKFTLARIGSPASFLVTRISLSRNPEAWIQNTHKISTGQQSRSILICARSWTISYTRIQLEC